jgi:hypothetical protein
MVSSTLLTMKHGEIACVVGRVIGVSLLLRINQRISARHEGWGMVLHALCG